MHLSTILILPAALGLGYLAARQAPPASAPKLTAQPERSHLVPQQMAREAATKQNQQEVQNWITRISSGSPTEQVAAALELSKLTSTRTIKELLNQQHKWPASSVEELIRAILMARWTELDAHGAVAYTGQHLITQLPDTISAYAAREPEQARELVLGLPPSDQRTMAWRNLCLAQLPAHPERVWEMLTAAPCATAPRRITPDAVSWINL